MQTEAEIFPFHWQIFSLKYLFVKLITATQYCHLFMSVCSQEMGDLNFFFGDVALIVELGEAKTEVKRGHGIATRCFHRGRNGQFLVAYRL